MSKDPCFKKGEKVFIFNPSKPDDPIETEVVGFTNSTWSVPNIRIKGASKYDWSGVDGGGITFNTRGQRLVRPADLPAAQEEARQKIKASAALYNTRTEARKLLQRAMCQVDEARSATDVTQALERLAADIPRFFAVSSLK